MKRVPAASFYFYIHMSKGYILQMCCYAEGLVWFSGARKWRQCCFQCCLHACSWISSKVCLWGNINMNSIAVLFDPFHQWSLFQLCTWGIHIPMNPQEPRRAASSKMHSPLHCLPERAKERGHCQHLSSSSLTPVCIFVGKWKRGTCKIIIHILM